MVFSSTAVINNKSHAVEAASKSAMENKNIARDSNSSTTKTNRREGSSENAHCQQPLKNENKSKLKNVTSESLADSDQSRGHDHGDSTFAALGLLSSPKANSGQMSYCGSTSHRSNSSTTSARSFAFPVLASEWGDSPARMMEADRSQLRKRRRYWKLASFCCKF